MVILHNLVVEVKTTKQAKQKVELAKKLVNFNAKKHNIEVEYHGKASNDSYGVLTFQNWDEVEINSENLLIWNKMVFDEISSLFIHISIFDK